jgi:hypothetical protein
MDSDKTDMEKFRAGVFPLYAIVGIANGVPVLRKVDDRRVAIVTWKNRSDAEGFRTGYQMSDSSVVEITYQNLMELTDTSFPSGVRISSIEIR